MCSFQNGSSTSGIFQVMSYVEKARVIERGREREGERAIRTGTFITKKGHFCNGIGNFCNQGRELL